MSYSVLLYYCFASVEEPHVEAATQRAWCEELGLKGRLILANEGINGTLSGLEHQTAEYMARMASHPLFGSTEFKIDSHDRHAFKKLSVKVRPEIVTLGLPTDPLGKTGERLEPAEFRRRMADPEAIILDIRNDYEFEMGRFQGAIRPPVESFREFPQWLRDRFGDAMDRPILTYCTGGIRCEKLTAWMVAEGFKNVSQLHGGIFSYVKDPQTNGVGFDGDCFMFDDRLSIPVGAPISCCEKCTCATARYVNCSNADCNRLYFLCEACEAANGLSCSDSCDQAARHRAPNERLAPNLRTPGERLRQQRHRAKRRLSNHPAKVDIKLSS